MSPKYELRFPNGGRSGPHDFLRASREMLVRAPAELWNLHTGECAAVQVESGVPIWADESWYTEVGLAVRGQEP